MSRWQNAAPWVIALIVLMVAIPAISSAREATISLGRDPEPPFCVLNPGGTVDINWNIDYETTPNYIYYKLEDPSRTIILEDEFYPGASGVMIDRSWTVPGGLADGKYWIRVEYWSFEAGNESERGSDVLRLQLDWNDLRREVRRHRLRWRAFTGRHSGRRLVDLPRHPAWRYLLQADRRKWSGLLGRASARRLSSVRERASGLDASSPGKLRRHSGWRPSVVYLPQCRGRHLLWCLLLRRWDLPGPDRRRLSGRRRDLSRQQHPVRSESVSAA